MYIYSLYKEIYKCYIKYWKGYIKIIENYKIIDVNMKLFYNKVCYEGNNLFILIIYLYHHLLSYIFHIFCCLYT